MSYILPPDSANPPPAGIAPRPSGRAIAHLPWPILQALHHFMGPPRSWVRRGASRNLGLLLLLFVPLVLIFAGGWGKVAQASSEFFVSLAVSSLNVTWSIRGRAGRAMKLPFDWRRRAAIRSSCMPCSEPMATGRRHETGRALMRVRMASKVCTPEVIRVEMQTPPDLKQRWMLPRCSGGWPGEIPR
jgi:hypothetical protein